MSATGFDLSFPDDRMLDGVARQVVAELDERFPKHRIEHAATQNERLRLARELHDGVLQSLTGAVLQLEAMSRLVDDDPRAARERLREIQELIIEEQRELRMWIESMRHASSDSMASHAELGCALQRLCNRASRWGPRVALRRPETGMIPRSLGDAIYRVVEEGLSNVRKHARANVARVEVTILHQGVRIVVEDDGCGFPYRGRYDLAMLKARRLGPVSLRERVESLHGTLTLASTLSGSRLDISLPLQKQIVSPGGRSHTIVDNEVRS